MIDQLKALVAKWKDEDKADAVQLRLTSDRIKHAMTTNRMIVREEMIQDLEALIKEASR